MLHRFAAVTLLALAACAPKQETAEQMAARLKAESDSARPAIAALSASFARNVAAGRADSVALLYAEDATLMLPNQAPVRGRAAIRAKVAELIGYGTMQFACTMTRLDASGPLAVEQGVCIQNFTPGPGAPAGMAAMFPDTMKYVTAYQKVNGAWLAIADISNTSKALRAPGATQR